MRENVEKNNHLTGGSPAKARKNPLRRGVVYNSLSNMLKNFANKKRNTPEVFENINDKLDNKQQVIAKRVVKEIQERLKFLNNVGLEYLSLSAP